MNESIVGAIKDMLDMKGMDRNTLVDIVESAFVTVLKKQYEQEDAFSVTFNTDRGDIEIFRMREVVPDDEVENEELQIGLTAAKEVEDDLELGDDFVEMIDYTKFGRRTILNLKNAILQKTREVEKSTLFDEYHSKIGEIIYADVYQVNPRTRDVTLNLEKVSFRMPAEERIPFEIYRRRSHIRVLIKDVQMKSSGEPEIIVSRADNRFIERMFELEVPEIADGIITIRGISRVPGWRCKIMVESTDPRVHAVGSCVGMKGIRIQAIVRELRTEKIDIVEYSSDKKRLVKDALVPTKPVNIEYGDESDTLQVIFTDSDFAKIRRNIEDEAARGVDSGDLPENESEFAKDINIRLVERLAVIDIVPTSESRFIAAKLQDRELPLLEVDELTDEQVTRLTEAGYETAEEVLDDQLENIIRKSDLPEAEVTEIKHLLGGYFQDTKIQDVLELPVEIRDAFIENGYEFVDDVMDADQRQLLEKTGLDEEQISEAVNIMTSYSEDEPVEEKVTAASDDPEETEDSATVSDDEELPEVDVDVEDPAEEKDEPEQDKPNA
jgi:transcription termination/antitermination protein NusA